MRKATLLITVFLWVGYIAQPAASYEDCPPKPKECDYHTDCAWQYACSDGKCEKCRCAKKSQCRFAYDGDKVNVTCDCSDSDLKGPYCCCNYTTNSDNSDCCCAIKYSSFNQCDKYSNDYKIYTRTRVYFNNPVVSKFYYLTYSACQRKCSESAYCNVYTSYGLYKYCYLYKINNFITNVGSFRRQYYFTTGFRMTTCNNC